MSVDLATSRPSYEDRVAGFGWHIAERALGYEPGAVINIGWHCSDRICALGRARSPALVWESAGGETRAYTFDDLRQLSNSVAAALVGLGLEPGERVCLFLDRVPALYIAFLGILKMGAVAQPLFSAFGEDSLWTRLDDAGTAVVLTQKPYALSALQQAFA